MQHLYFPKIFFDTNTFYPPQASEKKAMSEIEAIYNQLEDIMIEIPHSVQQELKKAPKWIQSKISPIYTIKYSLTEEQRKILSEIRLILFPNHMGLKQNEENDAVHIYEAQKYCCQYFVTLDKKHILSKKSELKKRFHLYVITPSECLDIIATHLRNEKTKC